MLLFFGYTQSFYEERARVDVLCAAQNLNMNKGVSVRCKHVIAFTGRDDRILPALHLAQQHHTQHVLISGVDAWVKKSALLKKYKGKMRIFLGSDALPLPENITLGYEAFDTQSNAEEAWRWMRRTLLKNNDIEDTINLDKMRRYNVTSKKQQDGDMARRAHFDQKNVVCLVTHPFHMPRSIGELHHVLPKWIKPFIYAYPVQVKENMRQNTAYNVRLFIWEYHKFLASKVLQWLGVHR